MKTIIITGASDGIGLAAARALRQSNHNVVVVGRSPEKTRAVATELGIDYLCCDFARLDDVRTLAEAILQRYPTIDVLCNNAGGIMGPRQVTEDGHERTFQVNHLAPFLLTNLLLPRLITSRASVIATSSSANKMSKLNIGDLNAEHKYVAFRAYGTAKLANIMFTRELHHRYAHEGVAAASFEPGPVATNFAAESTGSTRLLYHSVLNRFLLTPAKGADTLVWLATTTPSADWAPGEHYGKRRITKAHRAARDQTLCEQLWGRSDDMVSGARR